MKGLAIWVFGAPVILLRTFTLPVKNAAGVNCSRRLTHAASVVCNTYPWTRGVAYQEEFIGTHGVMLPPDPVAEAKARRGSR